MAFPKRVKDDTVYSTFEGWKLEGRIVMKGARAAGITNAGNCLFAYEDTEPMESPTKSVYYDPNFIDDDIPF